MKNRILPWSQGRYTVSEAADVYDDGRLVESMVLGDKELLNLEWFRGNSTYEKELVVACAFCNVAFDDSVIDLVRNKMRIVFRDGDHGNVYPGNLTYLFTEPIESRHPGFFLIPGFPSYVLNNEGTLLSLHNGKPKTWTVMKSPKESSRLPGYEYTTLYEETKSSIGYKHRLLCLVFKEMNIVFNKAVVNHIDGNKENSTLENLEWVTYSENNKHAWDTGLILGKDKVLVKNLKTSIVRSFRSLRECAKWLGEDSAHYVASRLQDRSDKVYPDLLAFKLNDNTEWPDFKVAVTSEHDVFAVLARNVFTEEITIFGDSKQVERNLGVPSRLVLDHCRLEKLLPANGHNFRFLCSEHNWPQHTKLHLEVYKQTPLYPRNGIFVYDLVDDKRLFFPTQDECCRQIGIQKVSLSTIIFTGRLFQKRYRFEYFDLKKTLQESISSEAY